MHILLLILKILGWTLLGVVGLALFILLLVLMVPVRYKIIGLSDEKMQLEFKFSYLLTFFRGVYSLSKTQKSLSLSLFWGLLKISPKEKKKDYTKDFISKEEDEKDESEEEDSEDFEEQFTETSEDDFDDEFAETEKTLSSKTVNKKNVSRKKSLFEKITEIKRDYLNETNKKAVKYLIKQLGYILKKYLPRKAKGNLYFGTTDPATTGEILGALSLIPLMYSRGLNIYPDFETDEFYIQGRLEAKGFIQIGVLLVVGIRLLFNKDTRSLILLFLKR